MNKAESLFAGLKGAEVKIAGGYHQVNKGYLASVETKEGGHLTVPFTDLEFQSDEEQAKVFENLYLISPETASLKGHKKGVPRCNFQTIPLETANLTYSMDYKSGKLKIATA